MCQWAELGCRQGRRSPDSSPSGAKASAKKEIHRVHAADAVLGGGRHRVERDHGLRIVVTKVAERPEFAFEDTLAAKRLRDLAVGGFAVMADDEVYFQSSAFSNEHGTAAPEKFIVYDPGPTRR